MGRKQRGTANTELTNGLPWSAIRELVPDGQFMPQAAGG